MFSFPGQRPYTGPVVDKQSKHTLSPNVSSEHEVCAVSMEDLQNAWDADTHEEKMQATVFYRHKLTQRLLVFLFFL